MKAISQLTKLTLYVNAIFVFILKFALSPWQIILTQFHMVGPSFEPKILSLQSLSRQYKRVNSCNVSELHVLFDCTSQRKISVFPFLYNSFSLALEIPISI